MLGESVHPIGWSIEGSTLEVNMSVVLTIFTVILVMVNAITALGGWFDLHSPLRAVLGIITTLMMILWTISYWDLHDQHKYCKKG